MDLMTQAALSYYEEISPMNEHACIVRHRESGRIFVKKTLDVYCLPVYEELQARPDPDIPQIFELHHDEDRLIVIEEYVSGETLADLLKERGTLDEKLTLTAALRVCSIICRLQQRTPPIVHRDIKPENILLRSDSTVCLLDLNAARCDTGGNDTVLIGTPGYAAPEQYGFTGSDVRTDIFALGRMMTVMLTGAPDRELPAGCRLAKVIARATAFSPRDRYQTAPEMMDALGLLQHPLHLKLTPPLPPQRSPIISWAPPGFRRRRPWLMIPAGIFYLWLMWECGPAAGETLTDHIMGFFFFLICIGIIFFDCNYRGIRNFLDIRNRFVRLAVILCIDVCIFLSGDVLAIVTASLLT